jgi:hypothetical protein
MNILLERDPGPDPDKTFGTLEAGTLVLQTIERPWIVDPDYPCGHPTTSCVPVGTYELVLHDTMTHPKTFALVNPDLHIWHQPMDIPHGTVGRSDILIHNGNFVGDSEGCILVGIVRGMLNGEPAVLNSQTALLQFKNQVPWKTGHTLTIR